jgi:hypothetical protein
MADLILSRRKFLAGMFSLAVAAPAIVRAASLMPVKRVPYWCWRGSTIYVCDDVRPPLISRDWRYGIRVSTVEVGENSLLSAMLRGRVIREIIQGAA